MEIPDTVMEAVMAAEASRKNKPKKVEAKKVVEVLEKAEEPMLVEEIVSEIIAAPVVEILPPEKVEQPHPIVDQIFNDIVVSMEKANYHWEKPKEKAKSKNIFLDFLKKSIAKIEYLMDSGNKKFQLSKLGKPALIRPGTFVAKVNGDHLEYINSIELLMELFDKLDIDKIREESYYYGNDKNHCHVFRARLPEGYLASVCAVALRDLANELFENGDIKIVPRNEYDIEAVCEKQLPIRSDLPHMDYYNCLTLKVFKKDGTIKSWMPGVHPSHRRSFHLLDHFCVVGPGWDKR
jgi:hypothetical protein